MAAIAKHLNFIFILLKAKIRSIILRAVAAELEISMLRYNRGCKHFDNESTFLLHRRTSMTAETGQVLERGEAQWPRGYRAACRACEWRRMYAIHRDSTVGADGPRPD